MDSVNIIALIIIVGGGGWLNWHDFKKAWVWPKWRRQRAWNRFKRRAGDFFIDKEINSASVLLCIASVFIALALWVFGFDIYELYVELHKQIAEGDKTPEEYRGIAIRYFGIIAGAGAIIGYIIAIARNITANKQNRIAGEQNKISEQGRITESMGQAIIQTGAFNGDKPNIAIRLGGLYSLQGIMQSSSYDEKTIAKIIYSYVSENAKKDENQKPNKPSAPPREDVQAALDIIHQFNKEWKKQGKRVFQSNRLNLAHKNFSGYSFEEMDFSGTFLTGGDLSNAKLYNANFSGANLLDANLTKALLVQTDLSSTNLSKANLSATTIMDTNLSRARLVDANLSKAIILNVDLSNADLSGADLTDAVLINVNLSNIKNLTQEQINKAAGNGKTKLPEGLIRPKNWDDEDDEDKTVATKTQKPATKATKTKKPATKATKTKKPATKVNKTQKPATKANKTQKPATKANKTQNSTTKD